MKKIVALVLLLQIVFLAACSSNQEQNSSTAVVSSDTAVSANLTSHSFSIDQSQMDDVGQPKHESAITRQTMIKNVDQELSKQKLVLLSSIKPDIDDYQEDGMGNVKEYQYVIGKGIILSIYADKENDNVTRVMYFMSTSQVTKESLKYYSACVDAMMQFLCGENAGAIEDQLNLSNISEDQDTSADTDQYKFSYFVQDGTDVLMINSLSSRPVSGKSSAQDNSSDSIETSSKEFNLVMDTFVDVVNKGLAGSKYQALPKPTKTESDFPGFGKADCYDFATGDGVDLIIYTDQQNKKVVSIQYLVTTSKATKKSMKYYGNCLGTTLGYMADDEAERVDSELNLDNITKDNITSAHSSLCSFSYIVDKGTLMLLINPNE